MVCINKVDAPFTNFRLYEAFALYIVGVISPSSLVSPPITHPPVSVIGPFQFVSVGGLVGRGVAGGYVTFICNLPIKLEIEGHPLAL